MLREAKSEELGNSTTHTVNSEPTRTASLDFSDHLTSAVFLHLRGPDWKSPSAFTTRAQLMKKWLAAITAHCWSSGVVPKRGTQNSKSVLFFTPLNLMAAKSKCARERHIAALEGGSTKELERDIVQEERRKVHSVVQMSVCAVSKHRGRFCFFVPHTKQKKLGRRWKRICTMLLAKIELGNHEL